MAGCALSSSSAGEVGVGEESDQGHQHNRPEYGGEQEDEQNPEQAKPSAPSAETPSTKSSSLDEREHLWHCTGEQRGCVHQPFEVRPSRVNVSCKDFLLPLLNEKLNP